MTRTLLTVPQGEDVVQNIVRIEGDPAPGPEEGVAGFMALGTLFQTVLYSPHMLRSGGDCPNRLSAHHTGTAWVIETTTLTKKEPA